METREFTRLIVVVVESTHCVDETASVWQPKHLATVMSVSCDQMAESSDCKLIHL